MSDTITDFMQGYDKNLQTIDQKELDDINFSIGYKIRRLQDLKTRAKAEAIDRKTDFDKLRRTAKKRFEPQDIQVLEFLNSHDECYYTRGVANELEIEHEVARKSIKKLERLGLVQLVTGLFNEEDGMLAGSGWTVVYKRNQQATAIVDSYQAENTKLV